MRRNPISGTVVVFSDERGKTREQLARSKSRDWGLKMDPKILSGEECPFELGHEDKTPGEIRAYRERGTQQNAPGWWLRVVPSKFKAFDDSIDGGLIEEQQAGPFVESPAYGKHLIIVESADHGASLATVSSHQIREVCHVWREMTLLAASDRNIKYVFLFENYGPQAGASQPHPHSQMIALPMIPTRVLNELRGSNDYWQKNRKCFYCQELDWERSCCDRIVAQRRNFLAWCPFTSKTPYQVVISPKEHQSSFASISTYSPSGEKDPLTEFSELLQEVLLRVKICLNDLDYNLYFHTAPLTKVEMPNYHWHCQIEPVTTALVAGFEKGSGVFINARAPEFCAQDLRDTVLEI